MDKETNAMIFVTYGYLTAAKSRGDKGAAEMVKMYERYLKNAGVLDENNVLIDPIAKEQAKLSAEVTQ